MLSCFFTVCYILNAKPFVKRKDNLLNAINEFISLIIIYLVMVTNGFLTEVPQMQTVGDKIVFFLYFIWFFNGFLFLIFIV